MNPQLVYLYIHDIGRCFHGQAFSFTNDFNITYEPSNDKGKPSLRIESRGNPYRNLWGPNISNINLIVGKNGAGKSTLLDLFGSQAILRNQLFDNASWFALYHLEGDHFVAEGCDLDLVRFIAGIPEDTSQDYSFTIRYNFKQQTAKYELYFQLLSNRRNRREYRLNQQLVSLYLPKKPDRDWYKGHGYVEYDVEAVSYKRLYMQKQQYAHLYRFMAKEFKLLEQVFTIEQAVCELALAEHLFLDRKEERQLFDINLYGNVEEILYFKQRSRKIRLYDDATNAQAQGEGLSEKRKFIVMYLESVIVDLWLNSANGTLDRHQRKACKAKLDSIVPSDDKLAYLLEVIAVLSGELNPVLKQQGGILIKPEPIRRVIGCLERVRDGLFRSPSSISVLARQSFDEGFFDLLAVFDHADGIGLKHLFEIKFRNLSAGELEFISGFAGLHAAIQIGIDHSEIDTVLLLLDEPDASFHPEWSRRYIHYLSEFIKLARFDRPIQFQIIMTTHSPFMISDVPSEHITCIDVKERDGKLERFVKKADFGLMGNFYDIIKSDFFIESPIGAFAATLFKSLIDEINEWNYYNPEAVNRVDGIIASIGEDVIRSKLQEHLRAKVRTFKEDEDLRERIRDLEKELESLKKQAEGRHDQN